MEGWSFEASPKAGFTALLANLAVCAYIFETLTLLYAMETCFHIPFSVSQSRRHGSTRSKRISPQIYSRVRFINPLCEHYKVGRYRQL